MRNHYLFAVDGHADLHSEHGPNRGDLFHLYDRSTDVGEGRDIAAANPAKVAELYGVVRERAGRPLPTHPF